MLAAALGYALLDTGAIYRVMALRARERGIAWDDGPGVAGLAAGLDISFKLEGDVNRVFADGQELGTTIRTPEISDGASRVSALPEVRAALLELQRRIGAAGGVVVEGRDIGTVVFPRAQAKFFLTASADERARRRVAELRAAGRAGRARHHPRRAGGARRARFDPGGRAAPQGGRRAGDRFQRPQPGRGRRPDGRRGGRPDALTFAKCDAKFRPFI